MAPKLWVYAEGEKTEISWLEHLKRIPTHGVIEITILEGQGVPYTLFDKARAKREEISRERRPAAQNDEVWLVFDRDEFPKIPDVWQGARDNGLGIVLSTPCYEIWPLLHLEDHTASLERHALQSRLHQVHPAYHHKRAPTLNWQPFAACSEQAIRRAISLHRRHAGVPGESLMKNPNTTAWLLHLRCLHAKDESGQWFLRYTERWKELLPLVYLLAEPLRGRVLAEIVAKPRWPDPPT